MNRLLLETSLGQDVPVLGRGLFRAGIWEENGWMTAGPAGDFQRLAGRIGFAKEFPIAPTQTIGFEIVAGGGRGWGDLPEHARFYAGRSPGQFLHDAALSAHAAAFPSGPLLRSFGEREAGLARGGGRPVGGDTFWHANLNLTLPIRALSRPLIPDESTDLTSSDGTPLTLRDLLSRQVSGSGKSFLIAHLMSQGLTSAQARQQADEIYGDITPATDFIIQQANLFAVKPLLMLDVARLSGRDGFADGSWLAVGGGLQLTLVTAKFDFGYMHTVSGPTFGDRGNLFFRLVFQNLF
jgi:hypothetical protein